MSLRFLAITALLILPIVALGAVLDPAGIVPCGNNNTICHICDITKLAQNIINFAVYFVTAMAIILFMYAGFKYATAAANPSQIEEAHKMFWNVLIGMIFVLGAWLIVDTIMKALFNEGKFGPWNALQCVSAPDDSGFFGRGAPTPSIGVTPTPRPGVATGCPSCVPLDSSLPVKPGIGSTIDPSMNEKLIALTNNYTERNWQITEAYPPTITHVNACHSSGTCVDANFVGSPTSENIKNFIGAAQQSGLRPVYEVPTPFARDQLISQGVPASNIQAVSKITAPHFSLY
ncbi:hypothetical protein A3A35_00980 [Candidatus Kaiserbacteria bacterium RIFCSPLOWO2_01_FULL_51_21]|uniref:Uncharacterized protein n=1 Tax=Candidatus Kaiserbacteria bacterium RIFCSPLOWO2_01_FULL_51_21 TaxID=1798508 RepID=A0A1F6ECS9_9BACT|nr:MAG: hypothetical protein A3A35_00980 [Candidatus Kaiserbacteria bacterium RIFCSPLOWO2_01_FULL_51_21]